MKDPRKSLEAYYDFKKEKKLAKYKSEITEMDCIIIRKIDMINWKNFYEYDESLLSNGSKLVEWGKKIKKKIQSQQAPSCKILSTYNEIKNELSKGISIVNRNFINSSELIFKTRFKNIQSYVGNKKILLHFNDIAYGHWFIVKIGGKSNTQYVLIDRVKPFTKELPNEIMNAKEEQLANKKFVSLKSIFEIYVFKKINIIQKENNLNTNTNENNHYKNFISIDNNINNNILKKINPFSSKERDNLLIESKINNENKNVLDNSNNDSNDLKKENNILMKENNKLKEDVLNLNKRILKLENAKANLNDKISDLENKIVQLNNKIDTLNNDNINYQSSIKKLTIDNNNLENKLKKINEISNNLNKSFSPEKDELLMSLMEKDKEIRELKILKEALPFELKEGEKLLTVIFQSSDQKLHYSLICKDSEKFNLVENRLYEVYPQYEESNNVFNANGIKITKSKTLKENKIKYSDVIILIQIDN